MPHDLEPLPGKKSLFELCRFGANSRCEASCNIACQSAFTSLAPSVVGCSWIGLVMDIFRACSRNCIQIFCPSDVPVWRPQDVPFDLTEYTNRGRSPNPQGVPVIKIARAANLHRLLKEDAFGAGVYQLNAVLSSLPSSARIGRSIVVHCSPPEPLPAVYWPKFAKSFEQLFTTLLQSIL